MEQGSAEWFRTRLGKVTASNIWKCMNRTKDGKLGSYAHTYLMQLVTERITGAVVPHYVTAAMQHGIDTEDQALAGYELMTGRSVSLLGFADHPTIKASGASPDALVGDNGLVEVKCPETHTHLANLLRETPDPKYVKQMQWQMACTGRDWCDFISFDDRVPKLSMQMQIIRVERSPDMIAKIEEAVTEFLTLVDEKVAQLQSLGQTEAAA